MNKQSPHARDQRFAAARRERRERNRKKPDILGAIRVAVALVVVAQCIRVAFTSPRMRLLEVRVTGTQRLSTEQVQELGGIPVGQNIFRCNLVQVSRRLRRDPVIKETIVTRELPNTIHATIRERVPAIQVMAAGQRFHADEEGFVFQHADAFTREMPLIQLPESQVPVLGEPLEAPFVKALWECNRLASEQGLKLRNLRVKRIDGLMELWLNVETAPTAGGAPYLLAVRLGRETDLPEKFRDIGHTLTWSPLTKEASYLDVMCAGSPVYMTMTDSPDATEAH